MTLMLVIGSGEGGHCINSVADKAHLLACLEGQSAWTNQSFPSRLPSSSSSVHLSVRHFSLQGTIKHIFRQCTVPGHMAELDELALLQFVRSGS